MSTFYFGLYNVMETSLLQKDALVIFVTQQDSKFHEKVP